MRIFFFLLAVLLICGNCSKGTSIPDFETEGFSSGDFGFQSILGNTDSGDFGRVLHIKAPTLVYDINSSRIDSFEVTINGILLNENRESPEFDYLPDKKYSFEIKGDFGNATGEVTAPSISKIQFKDLPESHFSDQSLLIEWEYSSGESNNGAIIVDANGHNSGILPPETTSYIIPANALENRTGDNQISVTSIRYLKFPKLINPADNTVRFIEGVDNKVGSYFGVFTSINRYVEILRPN